MARIARTVGTEAPISLGRSSKARRGGNVRRPVVQSIRISDDHDYLEDLWWSIRQLMDIDQLKPRTIRLYVNQCIKGEPPLPSESEFASTTGLGPTSCLKRPRTQVREPKQGPRRAFAPDE